MTIALLMILAIAICFIARIDADVTTYGTQSHYRTAELAHLENDVEVMSDFDANDSMGARRLSWWAVVYNTVHGHCPPLGKPRQDCLKRRSSGGSGGGGGGSSSGGGGSSSGGGGGGGGSSSGGGGGGDDDLVRYYAFDDDTNGGGSGGGGSGGGGSGGGDGGSSSSASTSSTSYESETGSASALNSSKGLAFFGLMLAAVAVATTIAAIVVGQGKAPETNKHALNGILKRRMTTFQNLVQRCECSEDDVELGGLSRKDDNRYKSMP